MSDTMKPQSFSDLLHWILKEYEQRGSIFGIHRSMFYTPPKDGRLATEMFGQTLAAPIGPAAGPHTQMAQNIISSWLTGGRYIELKTVQIMDELEIPRPCIDMEDEGYNVEWSQELKLKQSIREYVNAWALLHILPRLLGFDDQPFGTIFNMSVGYNLEGIQSGPMTRFMETMVDATEELDVVRQVLRQEFPQFAGVEIPNRLTNNVTLSTMHGCPPDEIERIARYMLEGRGLHTTIKLNPTLLGKETVLGILNDSLGFREIDIPDRVFEHDLRYDRALELIRTLQGVAADRKLAFGVKLSNTLPIANHRSLLPGEDMYMSGRALYPITVSLFNKLAHEFKGNLKVSYSAGADALNVVDILAAGARPVTVASDLLKPGGYARFVQYLENIETALQQRGVANVDGLSTDRLNHLERMASEALANPRYKKEYYSQIPPKVKAGLELFDCTTAPCTEQCAVCQDVPEYNWLIAQGEDDRALEVILSRNPLPGVTGYVCTHLCQTHCIRNDYEEPVAIRMLKRHAVEHGKVALQAGPANGRKVAIVGSGPSGLAAGYFLALNGVKATIFEAKDVPGGMLRLIPSFRLPTEIIQNDVDRITGLGVEIKLSHPVQQPPEALLGQGFDAVYVASGFQKNIPLQVEGVEGKGVFSALDLLERTRRGETLDLGRKALVIGGGDTAMDAARVAKRLTGSPATLVYRRTRQEMPASPEELEGALEEGTLLEELLTPKRVVLKDGQVAALECLRNRLGEPGADGRRKPVVIPGSEFQIEADAVILAIGQLPDLTFMDGSQITLDRNGAITVQPATGQAGLPHVFAGGDVVEGPESIIAACADGRRAAEAICQELGLPFVTVPNRPARLSEADILAVKRARAQKEVQARAAMLPAERRTGFDLIESALEVEDARREAARCLQCSSLCDKCVEVCPNRANESYFTPAITLTLPRLSNAGGGLSTVDTETFSVRQSRQIIHLDDFCNECGNCATFCVHPGKPYREKPRLFFKRSDFELESDNAFYIESLGRGWSIARREGGQETRLQVAGDQVLYEDSCLKLALAPDDFQIHSMELKQRFEGEFSLAGAAEMYVILKGVTSCLPFLPYQAAELSAQ